MPIDAAHRIIVDINTDGFHDRGSAHVADVVARRIRAEMGGDPMVKSVRVETVKENGS